MSFSHVRLRCILACRSSSPANMRDTVASKAVCRGNDPPSARVLQRLPPVSEIPRHQGLGISAAPQSHEGPPSHSSHRRQVFEFAVILPQVLVDIVFIMFCFPGSEPSLPPTANLFTRILPMHSCGCDHLSAGRCGGSLASGLRTES